MRGKEIRLTQENVGEIGNWGEKVFAEACLERGNLEVDYQIPVGEKVIDFRVRNTSRNDSVGKLVEVTSSGHKNAKKGEQRRAMRESGSPNTVLYGESLTRINSAHHK